MHRMNGGTKRRVKSQSAASVSTAGALSTAVMDSTAGAIGGSESDRRLEFGSAALYADAVRMADSFVTAARHTGDAQLIRAAQEGAAWAMERAWLRGGLTQTEIADLRGIDQSSVSSAIGILRRRRSAALPGGTQFKIN